MELAVYLSALPDRRWAVLARGIVDQVYEWRLDRAEADSRRSLELAPNHPEVLQWRGVRLLATVDLQRRAVDIDPVDLTLRVTCAAVSIWRGGMRTRSPRAGH